MSATLGILEVLAGLARQAGRPQGLEELVGHAGDLGPLEQLAEQRAAAALGRADEVGDAVDTRNSIDP